jgi:hypothetical protein
MNHPQFRNFSGLDSGISDQSFRKWLDAVTETGVPRTFTARFDREQGVGWSNCVLVLLFPF